MVSLIFFSSSHRCQNDQRTRETCYASMHASWDMQLPTLIEWYLERKHNGLVGEELASCHQFQVMTVDIFGLWYVFLWARQCSDTSQTFTTIALSFRFWMNWQTLLSYASAFSDVHQQCPRSPFLSNVWNSTTNFDATNRHSASKHM